MSAADQADASATPAATSRAHHHRGLAAMLASLSAVGPFSIDAYLPSFQEVGRTFGASPWVVQQTLTAYIVPFAAMTLWQGAISDALGRRRVTLVTLALFLLASIGCTLAWSIEALLAFRVLQGMTAGTGMVIGRAIVRDVLEGAEARRLMSTVALVFAIAPAVAPVIGGWLHVWLGWRAVFGFLVLFTAALWLWCWRALPETLPPERRRPLDVGTLWRGYLSVSRSVPFAALVIAVTLNFSAVFLYVVSAPAFLMNLLHVSETGFLWLFGPITAGMVIGTWISGRTAGRLSNRRTVALAYVLMGTAAGGNLLFHFVHAPALPWSVLPLVLYVVGNALAMPSLTLMALDLFPHQRGLAASCQSFVQSSGNAIVTAVLAPALWGSAISLSTGMATLLAGAGGAFALYLRGTRETITPAVATPR